MSRSTFITGKCVVLSGHLFSCALALRPLWRHRPRKWTCLAQPNSSFDKATKSCNTTTTENVGNSPNSQTFTEETVTDYNSSPHNPHNQTSTDCADGVR